MDSGFVTALCAGIAAIIGAIALVLRQQRVNSRDTARERAVDVRRVRIYQRKIEVHEAITHALRTAMAVAGVPLPPSVATYEQTLDGLRAQLVTLDNDDPRQAREDA